MATIEHVVFYCVALVVVGTGALFVCVACALGIEWGIRRLLMHRRIWKAFRQFLWDQGRAGKL